MQLEKPSGEKIQHNLAGCEFIANLCAPLDPPAPLLSLTQAPVQLGGHCSMTQHGIGRLKHISKPLLHAPLLVLCCHFCPFSFCGLRQEYGSLGLEGFGGMTQV